MKKTILKKAIWCVFVIAFPFMMQAQSIADYSGLEKYSKWSVFAGPVMYNKASITPQYGEYTFENLPIYGFNAGFEYDFYPASKWSFVTGLYVAMEPIYKLRFTLKEEDICANLKGDYTVKVEPAYAPIMSFSLPLLVRYNIQVGEKSYLFFSTGLKAMAFPNGEAEYTYFIRCSETTESKQVFGLRILSPDNTFQGSFVFKTGFSYAMDKALLKANLVYVMNFQNTMSGEYQFVNLLTSPDTRGYYDLSGNYLGLMFSVSPKKCKSKSKSK
ncbi:MAG: hypothetical protein ACOXZ9_01955 [Bacteroidales bacterium]|jgi:hypothetical protein